MYKALVFANAFFYIYIYRNFKMQDINFELEQALSFNIKEIAKAILNKGNDRTNYIRKMKTKSLIDTLELAIKDVNFMCETCDIIQFTIKNNKVLTAKIVKTLK